MRANIRVGRIDVALPVNDHLGAISGVGDGIDASSKRAAVGTTLEQRVDRPLGGQPLAQCRDVRQLQRAPGDGRDLVGIREPVTVVADRGLVQRPTRGRGWQATHLLDELAGQHLL